MTQHRHYDVFGLGIGLRVLPDEVGGQFALIEALVPPGLGAPPNMHPGEAEAFRVIEGSFDFMVGDRVVQAVAGDVVVVPDGAPHAFTCTGDRPGRLAIVNAPGRMHVDFFRGVGRPLAEGQLPEPPAGPPDLAQVMAVAQAAGMTLLPPARGPA